MAKRIDDHSFWAGKGGKGSVLPSGGAKTKMESSAEGAGSVKMYEDTTQAIRSTQVRAEGKAKSRPLKDGNRN